MSTPVELPVDDATLDKLMPSTALSKETREGLLLNEVNAARWAEAAGDDEVLLPLLSATHTVQRIVQHTLAGNGGNGGAGGAAQK